MAALLFQHERASALLSLSLPAASHSPIHNSDPFSHKLTRAGCVVAATAHVACTLASKTFITKSFAHSQPQLSSLKTFQSSFSSSSSFASNCTETEELGWGDSCPLYSSHNHVTFHPKLLSHRALCTAATNHSDPMNATVSGIHGIAESFRPHESAIDQDAAPRTGSIARSTRETSGSVIIGLDGNGSSDRDTAIAESVRLHEAAVDKALRVGRVTRCTKETSVDVSVGLDGHGVSDCDTGIPFLDHMLDQIASHGLFDLIVKAKGDIHIDDHHTNEDVALALGTALVQAIGNRKGIFRFGDFSAPLDEALVHVSLDLSGRPHLGYKLEIPTDRVGNYDTQLVEHFFQSLVNTSGMTLHIHQLAGRNSHHIIEATFKAFAKALRQAVEYDIRREGTIPSSKGILSRY